MSAEFWYWAISRPKARRGRWRGLSEELHPVGVDRRGTHHRLVVAGGADAQPRRGAEEEDEEEADEQGDAERDEQLAEGEAGDGGEDGVHPKQGDHRTPAHHPQVDGIEPGHREDAREDRLDFQLGLQKGAHHAGAPARRDGEQDAEIGVGGVGEYGGDGRAEGKAAVDRQIGDIEDAVGDEEAERDKRVDEPQLHGAL